MLKWYGIEKHDGYSFEDKANFKPLQGADILAWQQNSHMRNVILPGKDEMTDKPIDTFEFCVRIRKWT